MAYSSTDEPLSPGTSAQGDRQEYTSEAVQQILQIALTRQSHSQPFSRSQLEEMALELGIPASELAAAEQQWQQDQGLALERQEFQVLQRRRLTQTVVKFAIVNSFLLTLDQFTSPGEQLHWSLVVLLVWGMGVTLKAWQTFQPPGPDSDRRFEYWRKRKQLKRSVQSLVQQALDRLNTTLS
jgi:hypothetical protein